jgi:NitT/TauT family transport system substrate-binding protein
MQIRPLLRNAASVVLLLASTGVALSAPEHVRIMVGGVEKILYLPAKLAEQLGYYKDEGLDVELISVTSGSISETGLLSGSAEAAVGAYEQSIHIQAKGKFVTSIVQISRTPQEALLVSTKFPDIKTVADLKGKTVGVSGFGSLTHFLSMDLAERAGLQKNDVSYIAAGAGNTFITAFQQGRVEGGMTQEPTISVMLDSGDAKVLLDLRTPEDTRKALGGEYPGSALYVRSDWLAEHKDTATKMAHAIKRALQYVNTHTAEEIAAQMPPSYYQNGKEVYLEALQNSIASFTNDGRMPEGGPETVLGVLSQFGDDVSPDKIDLTKTYTNELVDLPDAVK